MFKFFIPKKEDVVPSSEALMIPEIRKLWDRDTTKMKSQAKNDLAIVYYGGYFNSPYDGYSEKEKWDIIGKSFKGSKSWRPHKDQAIKDALDMYIDLQYHSSKSLRLLTTMRQTLEVSDAAIRNVQNKIKQYSEIAGDEEIDDKNLKKSLEYIDKLIDLGKNLPETLNKIRSLEEQVNKELNDSTMTKGGKSMMKSEKPPEER